MYGPFATPHTVAHQASLSVGFPRQEYCSGLPFPSPGDLPDPSIKPASPALAGKFFTTEPSGNYTYLFFISTINVYFLLIQSSMWMWLPCSPSGSQDSSFLQLYPIYFLRGISSADICIKREGCRWGDLNGLGWKVVCILSIHILLIRAQLRGHT